MEKWKFFLLDFDKNVSIFRWNMTINKSIDKTMNQYEMNEKDFVCFKKVEKRIRWILKIFHLTYKQNTNKNKKFFVKKWTT